MSHILDSTKLKFEDPYNNQGGPTVRTNRREKFFSRLFSISR